MASSTLLLPTSILVSCLAATSYGATCSSFQKSLVVTVSAKAGEVIKAGEANITVTWSLNTSFPARTDSKLCYAPISQKDRAWRKTKEELSKDRTCQIDIVTKSYTASNNSFTWTVERDVPSATYFVIVRAYAFNAEDDEVAYGQTINSARKTNLFEVHAITGCHASLDITSVCFSVFSIVSLAGFFYMEKREAKMSQQR